MKILIVVDKLDTAIHRLAKYLQTERHGNSVDVITFHPKRPSSAELSFIETNWKNYDIIQFHYYKSGLKLLELYPFLTEKELVFVHHNPYSINDFNPNIATKVVACNSHIFEDLKKNYPNAKNIEYIPLCVNLEFFAPESQERKINEPIVLMVANRIESKKGILPVAKACEQLNYKLILVGNVSDPEYLDQILACKTTEFRENITDAELLQLYNTSTVHVCNSVNNFESGTLPILESMSCGLPVITRNVGHVQDLYNGKNLILNSESEENIENLMRLIKSVVTDAKLVNDLTSSAFETIKNWGSNRYILRFNLLWTKIRTEKYKMPLVSIVIPTHSRPKEFDKCIRSIYASMAEYPNIEVISILNNTSDDIAEEYNENMSKLISEVGDKLILRTINLGNENAYPLAEARNLGIIHAMGDYIMFLDDRLVISPDAVKNFYTKYAEIAKQDNKAKFMLWGVKDGALKAFVENLSFIKREHIIDAGMFLERMNFYGGMTQELKTRLTAQGFNFYRADDVNAISTIRASSKTSRRLSIIQAKFLLFQLYRK